MQIDPDALPDDTALLQQMPRSLLQQQGELHAENDRLRLLIQRLSRHRFGRRSEQLPDAQLQLGLEDLEQTVAENQAAQDAAQLDGTPARRRSKSPARNHGALPGHRPRYEVVVDGGRRIARAAAGRCTASGSCAPSNSTSCPRNRGCASPAARDMPAAPARKRW